MVLTDEELENLVRLDGECQQANHDVMQAQEYSFEAATLLTRKLVDAAARTGLSFEAIGDRMKAYMQERVGELPC